MKDGEVKVKSWCYTCESQALVIYLTSLLCKHTLENCLGDAQIQEIFPEQGDINITLLKKYVGSLQVIFEIDELFKEDDISREIPRRNFANLIINKVVRELLNTPPEGH